ncbi:dihydropteroate synthase [Shewanella sp. WXL01]|uniref:dihydropteroate synthase n=1 Tax=Shewanella sp. WXL01 TaxID=2709721 RepID=UPI0014383259|nr:dihydropteroate synthase [Shewanella sp. WXL01]
MFELTSADKTLDLSSPQIMGIANITPDSFSDGGQFESFKKACEHVDYMVAEGAVIIDVGGESTRPGAKAVSVEEELERVIPIIKYTAEKHDVWISVDTSKPQVMEQAVLAGAHMINDVKALREPGALEVAAKLQVPVCLMHMQGSPETMQDAPAYVDVVEEVLHFFEQRIVACEAAGIDRSNLILDPGFGFGKTLEHNYRLLACLPRFHELHLPLLIGMSRKSMIGDLLERPVEQRLAGSLSAALIAAQQGAQILRVHDVAETSDVLRVMSATMASV